MRVFSKDSSPFVASLLVTIGSGERLLAYSIQRFVEVLSSWGAGGVAVVRVKINRQNREAQFLSLVTKTREGIFMLRIVCKIVL